MKYIIITFITSLIIKFRKKFLSPLSLLQKKKYYSVTFIYNHKILILYMIFYIYNIIYILHIIAINNIY